MDKTGRGFEYLRNKLPNVSDAIIKEGVFIGPQIRELMQDKQLYEDLNETERNAWLSFKRICKDFLRNHKTAKYQHIVQDLLTSYKAMRCNMKLKIHFLESHLDSSQKISAKSVTNTVKDFTKTFWLRKSRTKASGPDVCWQTIAGHWRGMYLKPITGENHMPLHFRGKFLPVSLLRKVLLCIESSVSLKLCLIEKFCIHIWILHKKYC